MQSTIFKNVGKLKMDHVTSLLPPLVPPHTMIILEKKNTPTTWADSKYFTDYACKEEIIIYNSSKSAVFHAYRKPAGILAMQTLGQEVTFPCETGSKCSNGWDFLWIINSIFFRQWLMPEFLKGMVYLNWFIRAESRGKSKPCLMKQSDQFVMHFPLCSSSCAIQTHTAHN